MQIIVMTWEELQQKTKKNISVLCISFFFWEFVSQKAVWKLKQVFFKENCLPLATDSKKKKKKSGPYPTGGAKAVLKLLKLSYWHLGRRERQKEWEEGRGRKRKRKKKKKKKLSLTWTEILIKNTLNLKQAEVFNWVYNLKSLNTRMLS